SAMIPSFELPYVFWSQIVQKSCNGALVGGLRAFIAEAAKRYPQNRVFSGYLAASAKNDESQGMLEPSGSTPPDPT
ncbi:MAG: hypothetical protein KDK70_34200, partial [Myxococcales bacterium]|nr:hypothetical protein [Myxococcales bacterium]